MANKDVQSLKGQWVQKMEWKQMDGQVDATLSLDLPS